LLGAITFFRASRIFFPNIRSFSPPALSSKIFFPTEPTESGTLFFPSPQAATVSFVATLGSLSTRSFGRSSLGPSLSRGSLSSVLARGISFSRGDSFVFQASSVPRTRLFSFLFQWDSPQFEAFGEMPVLLGSFHLSTSLALPFLFQKGSPFLKRSAPFSFFARNSPAGSCSFPFPTLLTRRFPPAAHQSFFGRFSPPTRVDPFPYFKAIFPRLSRPPTVQVSNRCPRLYP